MKKYPLSVVINTLNEEKNLRNCLETVKWAEEIVIVDMYSDDNTVPIAREYTERIFFHERMGYADPARQFALEQASHEWVLSVDADELVPPPLKERLLAVMQNDQADLVYLPHNNYFFGHLMQGTSWGARQDKHPRFYKKQFVRYSETVHDIFRIVNNPRVLAVEDPREGFIHFNYLDLEHFLDKLNRYTTIEAKNIFAGQKGDISAAKMLYKAAREFLRRFIVRKGYKDGAQGLYLSCLMAAYHVSTFAKIRLMKQFHSQSPREEIEKLYARIAAGVITEYRNHEEQ